MILVANYYPIAVVPIVAKILEKIVANPIIKPSIAGNNLLHPHQLRSLSTW